MKNNRSALREKIMVILYQIYLYKKGKMEYTVEDVIKIVRALEKIIHKRRRD